MESWANPATDPNPQDRLFPCRQKLAGAVPEDPGEIRREGDQRWMGRGTTGVSTVGSVMPGHSLRWQALPVLRSLGGILQITSDTRHGFAGGQGGEGNETAKEEHNFQNLACGVHLVSLIIGKF